MPEKQGPAALAGANRAGNRVGGRPLDTTIVPRAPAAMSEPKRSIAAAEANLRPTPTHSCLDPQNLPSLWDAVGAVATGGNQRRYVPTHARWRHQPFPRAHLEVLARLQCHQKSVASRLGLGARIRALCARRIEPLALTQSTQRRQVDEAVP
jgi:hypothetical protein